MPDLLLPDGAVYKYTTAQESDQMRVVIKNQGGGPCPFCNARVTPAQWQASHTGGKCSPAVKSRSVRPRSYPVVEAEKARVAKELAREAEAERHEHLSKVIGDQDISRYHASEARRIRKEIGK